MNGRSSSPRSPRSGCSRACSGRPTGLSRGDRDGARRRACRSRRRATPCDPRISKASGRGPRGRRRPAARGADDRRGARSAGRHLPGDRDLPRRRSTCLAAGARRSTSRWPGSRSPGRTARKRSTATSCAATARIRCSSSVDGRSHAGSARPHWSGARSGSASSTPSPTWPSSRSRPMPASGPAGCSAGCCSSSRPCQTPRSPCPPIARRPRSRCGAAISATPSARWSSAGAGSATPRTGSWSRRWRRPSSRSTPGRSPMPASGATCPRSPGRASGRTRC